MGRKQGLEILVEAARILADHHEIVFVLCGEGAAKDDLLQSSTNLTNVRFLPLQPLESLNELLNLADIHVLPQRADAADLVMPSKLTGMFASGKPVIATAFPGTEVGEVVSKAGVLSPPGDAEALANSILDLANDPEKRRRIGNLGRKYAESFLEKSMVLNQFAQELERSVSTVEEG